MRSVAVTECVCVCARSDSVRPFISGHVADSMAAEVIALLHGLLTAPVSLTAQSWAAAVEKVSLACLTWCT